MKSDFDMISNGKWFLVKFIKFLEFLEIWQNVIRNINPETKFIIPPLKITPFPSKFRGILWIIPPLYCLGF